MFAVNAPSADGPLRAQPVARLMHSRFLIYSPGAVRGTCAWDSLNAPARAEAPWLERGVGGSYYALAYLISAFMRGLDMDREVRLLFPAAMKSAKLAR